MKILVSGFQPFLGERINPSQEVLENRLQPVSDCQIHKILLPVEFAKSVQVLFTEIEQFHPDFVLMLGQASGRSKVSLEQVALNFLDSRYADERGIFRQNQAVIPGGPAAFISELPLREWAEELSRKGLPVERSLSAGSFVCNSLFYSLSHASFQAENSAPDAGRQSSDGFEKLKNKILFVHLPLLPEQGGGAPSLGIETMSEVIQELLKLICR